MHNSVERTTLMLPPGLKLRAAERAERYGVSLGEFIRSSIEARLEGASDAGDRSDPFWDDTTYFTRYADQEVSFTDGVSFALMARNRLTSAFAYDGHFDAVGYTAWPPPTSRKSRLARR